ncbi:MAG TPA: sigma-70 family RNA polymerase sigma factor [Acidobacteriota bacterium]|nr:sigma-70 family RNA polymerase sigma factor [Acidobacteriota bacterium]HOT00208.1 sigma-70 family RNA polymerase sigma factor [Acidobacteriota bacterium]HQF87718.1 sigma-70 family RNA polymerase sigma factor [Acidobacteriota bacterium]HQG93186.1 sigma-70 family RNA polymerase sigma factor [Acidobacteriota bacterium]
MSEQPQSVLSEELYQKLRERLILVAQSHVGDAAEDLVQETFFSLFDNIHRGKFRGQPTYQDLFCYSLGILKIIIIKEIRKRQQDRSRFLSDGPESIEEKVVVAMEESSEHRILDAEEQAGVELTSQQAREIFQTLPPHIQELIHLHVVQGWSYTQLSAHFNMPKQTLVSRFNVSMEKIRKKMIFFRTKAYPAYSISRKGDGS